jgi:hypothetical protein
MPQLPAVGAFANRPVVHHFDDRSWRSYRPGCSELQEHPSEILASQSPLDHVFLATESGGALGTSGYAALPGVDADQFYAESTPIWWIPARIYDLRDTWATFYLKEIAPLTVAPGYEPHLFIAANVPTAEVARGFAIDGWYVRAALTVGKGDWAYNEVFLANDPAAWVHYVDRTDTLEWTLGHCGYVGWMYLKDKDFRGVHATGVLGWDELCFNLGPGDLERVRAGLPLANALTL